MDPQELRSAAEQWRDSDPDLAAAHELAQLLEALDVKSEAELKDRFSGTLEFGTAGLRGVIGAGPNRMNRAVVRRTTAGLARYLKEKVPDVASRGVVIGRDGRRMSPEFAQDAAAVLAAEGIPALVFRDLVPTPVTSFATIQLKAAAAVMVTASHNPPEYNGYKVYWGDGAQIVPPNDSGIAAAIAKVEAANRVPLMARAEAEAKGLWKQVPDTVIESYHQAIQALRLYKQVPDDLTVVYTAMHGVGGLWMDEAMRRAGYRQYHPVAEQHRPDGLFPTVRFPNPEEPGAMDLSVALAEKVKADIVLANDPDADRLAAMVRDRSGALRALTGNELGLLICHYLITQKQPKPKKPLVITTIVSSSQLGSMARELGVLYDETLTGFKWIAHKAMAREKSEGAEFLAGFEEALGYTVGDVARDKDGIGSALVFADLAAWCRSRNVTVLDYLEEIQRRHGYYAAETQGFTFPGVEGAALIKKVMTGFRERPADRIGDCDVAARLDYQKRERVGEGRVTALTLPTSNVLAYELKGGGRVTLRPSGTEPKIKYYYELKETMAPGESLAAAKARATLRLEALKAAFLTLARERGQPASNKP